MKRNLTILFILLNYFAFTQEKQLHDGTYIAKNNNYDKYKVLHKM